MFAIGIRSFDSRLFLDISGVSNVHLWSIWICNYFRSIRCLLFVLRESILKVHVFVSS